MADRMRCLEFFEGEDGRLSMARLLMFLTFWPSTVIVLADADDEVKFSYYLAAFCGVYLGGRIGDSFANRRLGAAQAQGNDGAGSGSDAGGSGAVDSSRSAGAAKSRDTGKGIHRKIKA